MTVYNFENVLKIVFEEVVTNRPRLRNRGFEKFNKSYTEMPRKSHTTITNRFTDMTKSGLVFFLIVVQTCPPLFRTDVSKGGGACEDFRHSK